MRHFSDDPGPGDLSRAVKLFFDNGGSQCYVVRIANNARPSTVDLRNEANDPVLRLTAKNAGGWGESLRATVDYKAPHPESTFNLELFRWEVDARGEIGKHDPEIWSNLSMDPVFSQFTPTHVTEGSQLVDAASVIVASASPSRVPPGCSQSGRSIRHSIGGNDAAQTESFTGVWSRMLGAEAPNTRSLPISADGRAICDADLATVSVEVARDERNLRDTKTEIARRVEAVIGTVSGQLPRSFRCTGLLEEASSEDGARETDA